MAVSDVTVTVQFVTVSESFNTQEERCAYCGRISEVITLDAHLLVAGHSTEVTLVRCCEACAPAVFADIGKQVKRLAKHRAEMVEESHGN